MADLSTKYLGLDLASPVVVGASSLSAKIDHVKEAQEYGAGAMVIKSLFEEQIELERQELEEALLVGADAFAESTSYLPDLTHAGPEEHLYWVEKTRKAVDLPLIGSLNAYQKGTWVDWAKKLEEVGLDALELNVYTLGSDPARSGADIEKELVDVVASVKEQLSIPVSVKLSPWFTSLGHLAAQLHEAGADGLVLFNRFVHPDIDVNTGNIVHDLHYSNPTEALNTLRWIGLLHEQFKGSLAAATGVHDAYGVARMLLAGADAVQVVSAFYRNGLGHIRTLNDGLAAWMEKQGHKSLADFQGTLSQRRFLDPSRFERAQYVKMLLGFD